MEELNCMLTRIAKLFVTAILAIMVTIGALYLLTYQKVRSTLQASSLIAETTAGPIEYLAVGTGPVVVIVHGTPGGYDQFQTLARVIANAGYRVVVFSRPGYLRTPLDVGESVAEQAVALDALRAHLKIDQMSVVAISGGGPAGLRYAIDYPERVTAVALIVALSGELPPLSNASPPLRPFGMADDIRAHIAYSFPHKFIDRLGTFEANKNSGGVPEATRNEMARDLFGSLGFSAQRNSGYLNDAQQFYRRPLHQPVERISCPALLIYGENDTVAPPANGQLLVDRMVGEEHLVIVPHAGHAIFVTHANLVIDRLLSFLSR
jgi:pimeloyl-ACP methyl ester carboxylesterase